MKNIHTKIYRNIHIKSHISSLIQTLLSVMDSHHISPFRESRTCKLCFITAGREFHPAPKNFPYSERYYISICFIAQEFFLFSQIMTNFPTCFACRRVIICFANHDKFLIVSAIRFFATSTLITCTSTTSPTLTASRGCLINRSVICEMCTSPS